METLLPLPINNNLSSIPAGGTQAPAETSPGGTFLQVLAQYFGKKADGKMASDEQGLENLDSSTLANLLAALAVGNPSFISQETGISSGNGLSDLKEDSASVANALLEVYAQGKDLPGIQRETFSGLQSSISSRGNGAFFTSPLPSGEEKQGELPAGADRLRNFISSPVPSGTEGQTGQTGWVDPPQNPAVKAKPPEKEGSILPEGELEKPSPERVSIPPREMGAATTGDTGQEKIEPFDPFSQKKEIASHPSSKERMKGESFLATGGAEIKPTADPSPSSKQESPFISRQERFSEAEPPSFTRKESTETMVSDKHSVGEEDPAPSHPPQPATLQNMGGEVLSRSHEEKDGLQVLGIRNGQTHPSGKENQTSLGSYGASSQSTVSSFGFAEKVTEGKEVFAPTQSEPQSVNQQVGERVLWLIRNQEEKIKVTLDPPELGHLCLEIHRTKENIQATLLTDNPLTKATLESNQGEIQKIIENEGFKLEKFDVLVQQDLSSFQERKESQWHSDSRNSSASGKTEAPGSTLLDSLSRVPHRMGSESQFLDLFV